MTARNVDVRPLPWADDAACATTDPDAFFPEQGGPVKAAKRVCGRCLVRDECLEWALESRPEFGIYAGLSLGQLAELRERRTV